MRDPELINQKKIIAENMQKAVNSPPFLRIFKDVNFNEKSIYLCNTYGISVRYDGSRVQTGGQPAGPFPADIPEICDRRH